MKTNAKKTSVENGANVNQPAVKAEVENCQVKRSNGVVWLL